MPEGRARAARRPFRWLVPLRRRALRRVRNLAPKTFQGRLTAAFVGVLSATLLLVAMLVINRLGVYFDQQQQDDLTARARGVAQYVVLIAEGSPSVLRGHPVVSPEGVVDTEVTLELSRANQQKFLADQLAQADVRIRLGLFVDSQFVPSSNGVFEVRQQAVPELGQARERITSNPFVIGVTSPVVPYAVEVTLANPYTFRAAALANVTGLLGIIGIVALGLSVSVAAALARRFTTPLRRLTEASRDLAEGDLARRVPADGLRSGATELSELALQFNMMAERLQGSVDTIRRDRDRSREFLADVSHELRTPIAALRTFNELLVEGAADDPITRFEFLEASRAQLERLDWLALNLLELSKLESGLVLLDLRPEDLRATVEQAVGQAMTSARRRGVDLTLQLPDGPLQVRHDPVRVGQVVTNLVNNGLKFTPRGGRVRVEVEPDEAGAAIVVSDTGVGIEPAELPRIFERFFRGSRASEARGSGSGLGLAIVRNIVEMHHGTVTVSSHVGGGTTFRVTLPRDPRPAGEAPGAGEESAVSVAETSSSAAPNRNPEAAP